MGSIGLDGNSSLTDLVMDNKEIVGGAVGGMVLLVSLLVAFRRRSRGDYDWDED